MSHKRANATCRGTGFWGIRKNCAPVVGHVKAVPDWLRREVSGPESAGTTVHVLGFTPPSNWENILAGSIAESFFAAVARGHLQVSIEGGPELNADTITEIFQSPIIRKALEDQKDEPEAFDNSGQFLHALTSDEAKIEETENQGLGRCRLHILVGENLPKKVAVLRNGMLITSELQRLRRFSEFKEFAAVLECMSDKGNALLRAMEPPQHDDFEPDRLPTADQQRVAKIALRELAQWVRDVLKRHAQDPVSEVTEIDELAEFFGDDEEQGPSGSKTGDENPRGAIKIRARPIPPKKPSWTSEQTANGHGEADGADGGEGSGGQEGEDEGYADGSNESSGGDGGSSGGGGSGEEEKAANGSAIALRNVRAVVTAAKDRRISFTPDVTGDLRLELEDSGADTNRLLRIVCASDGTVLDGRLRMSCSSGVRVTLDLSLERPFEGTVRIKANAI